jgi:hypothetical protein
MQKKRDRREYNKNWYLTHKETENAGSQKYYAEHADKYRQVARDWRKSNPDKVREFKETERLKRPNYVRMYKEQFIEAYGGKCSCCGETAFEFLTCDHINGQNRKEDRKGADLYRKLRRLGWPKDKYRLLCINCNFSIGHYGYCPHESMRLRSQISIVDEECTRAIAG